MFASKKLMSYPFPGVRQGSCHSPALGHMALSLIAVSDSIQVHAGILLRKNLMAS